MVRIEIFQNIEFFIKNVNSKVNFKDLALNDGFKKN